MQLRNWTLGLLAFLVTVPFSSLATTYHLDPMTGSISNEGTAASPWSTLQEVIDGNFIQTNAYSPLPYDPLLSELTVKNLGAPVQAGDTLVLYDGLHGALDIRGAYNQDYITVMAAEGHTPKVSYVEITAGARWRLLGLDIGSEPFGEYLNGLLLFLESHGHHGPASHIEVIDCDIQSAADASTWALEDWLENVSSGIQIKGTHSLIKDNRLLNVYHGIGIYGDTSVVSGNTVVNFAGDGMRPLGSDILMENNLVKNCYDIDGNHDDGIQSFTNLETPLYRVTLRGNTILNFDDPDQPLRGTLQGIGLFDGPYHGWVIENNVVSADHYHGITIHGAIDCRIVNNTVTDPIAEGTPGPAWIRVGGMDGVPEISCDVFNNVAYSYQVGTEMGSNVDLDQEEDLASYFVDPAAFDFHLLPTSPLIDSADDEYAPATDRDGVVRPQGEHSDIGAYEFASGCTADLNDDGLVDVSDFLILNSSFGQDCLNCPADIDQDGVISVADFVVFNSSFGEECE